MQGSGGTFARPAGSVAHWGAAIALFVVLTPHAWSWPIVGHSRDVPSSFFEELRWLGVWRSVSCFGSKFGFYKPPMHEIGRLNMPGQLWQEIALALALLSDLGYRALIASRSLHRVWLLVCQFVWFHIAFVNLFYRAPGDDYLSDCFAEALRARLPLREARGFFFWIVLREKLQELFLLPTLCQLRWFERGKSASSTFCM